MFRTENVKSINNLFDDESIRFGAKTKPKTKPRMKPKTKTKPKVRVKSKSNDLGNEEKIKARVLQRKELENKIRVCDFKIRFIQGYLDQTIVLSRKTFNEVSEQLSDKGYPDLTMILSPDSKNLTASDSDSGGSFHYLMNMRLPDLNTQSIWELEESLKYAKRNYSRDLRKIIV